MNTGMNADFAEMLQKVLDENKVLKQQQAERRVKNESVVHPFPQQQLVQVPQLQQQQPAYVQTITNIQPSTSEVSYPQVNTPPSFDIIQNHFSPLQSVDYTIPSSLIGLEEEGEEQMQPPRKRGKNIAILKTAYEEVRRKEDNNETVKTYEELSENNEDEFAKYDNLEDILEAKGIGTKQELRFEYKSGKVSARTTIITQNKTNSAIKVYDKSSYDAIIGVSIPLKEALIDKARASKRAAVLNNVIKCIHTAANMKQKRDKNA